MGLAAVHQSGAQALYRNEWIDHKKTYYKIPVLEQRLYRIQKSVLAAAGLGEVPAQHFQLWSQGQQVPLYTTESSGAIAANGFIEFYGQPLDGQMDTELFPDPTQHVNKRTSYFSDTAYYFLTVNNEPGNLRFANTANLVQSTLLPPDSFYMHTYAADYFRGGFSFNYNYGFANVVGGQPVRSSIWDQGEGFASSPFNVGYGLNFRLENMRAFRNGPPMRLRHSVVGVWTNDKWVTLGLNDSVINRVDISGFNQAIAQINNIPNSRIDANDGVTFNYRTDDAGIGLIVPQSTSLELTYARRFVFENGRITQLALAANPAGNHLRISAFATDGQPPALYDLTQLKRYVGVLKADSILFALEPSGQDRQIVIANQTSALFRNVAGLTPMQFKNYALAAEQGNYLIISNKRLYNSNGQNHVNDYADYRRSAAGGNHNVIVAEVDELADQFCYGIRKHPLGIKNFVRYAMAQFTESPKYVLLMGRGSDYLGIRYSGSNAALELLNTVPTWGSPGSDNLLVSGSGLNPTPLVPVGRISAVNGGEIKTYLDKVKQFEALKKADNISAAQGIWRKNVLQLIGGNDAFLTSYIGSFMAAYSKIVSDSLMGALPKTYKRVNNPNLAKDLQAITNTINAGTSIITYSGHTSNSSIDFGINNPEDYQETNGKYPVFLANGCRAGNIFDLNYNRLQSKSVNLSDNFIFTANRGSIAFISNSDLGVIGPLDAFTNAWYKNAARKKYGQSLGHIQIGAIKDYLSTYGLGYFDRVNSEQVVLHGDPAVSIFAATKPDYAAADSFISIMPLPQTVGEDSLLIGVKFANIGAAIYDSVWVEVSHENNLGLPTLLTRKLVKPLQNLDSLQVTCKIKGIVDGGTNAILVRIDPDNAIAETDENNNLARKTFDITDAEIRPVYPYAFAIVNQPTITLTGSTVNPLQNPRHYRLQVDTSAQFNSSILFTQDTLAPGGAVSFTPAIAWAANTVYYWRLSPLLLGQPLNWQSSSFQFMPGTYTGFGQSHYFQHQKSVLDRIAIPASRTFAFAPKPQSLYAAHGIYGYSATEDSHLSFSVNGIMNIYSACVGQSLIFNLFDPITFAQRKNLTGEFGSGPFCDYGREYNFEFPYFPASNRKKIMDFMDQIPPGTIVAVRAIVDPPYDSLQVKYWKRDTAIYGSGNSLYHRLYNQGFTDLDSLNATKTFAFVYKKDDRSNFEPSSRFSQGVYDRILYNFYPSTTDTSGVVTSPLFGPAKAWQQFNWQGNQPNGGTQPSSAVLHLTGRRPNGTETLLKVYAPGNWNNDISDINASEFPFLRLSMQTKNAKDALPYQINNWKLFYEPEPDGALTSLERTDLNKPVLIRGLDSLKIGVAFKNISNQALSATGATITLTDPIGQSSTLLARMLKPLQPNDTAIVYLSVATATLPLGSYTAHIIINAAKNPVEQHWFNNDAWLSFQVTDQSLSVNGLTFTALPKAQQSELKWQLQRDASLQRFTVEHHTGNGIFKPLATLAATDAAGLQQYEWIHTTPRIGANYYRLKLWKKDGTEAYSGTELVRFSSQLQVNAYPNPFGNQITVQLPGNKLFTIKIVDAQGRTVLTQRGSGKLGLNTLPLPAGAYWLVVEGSSEEKIMKMHKY